MTEPNKECMGKNCNNSKKSKYYLAIDIGASSGRHIVGRREGGELKTREVGNRERDPMQPQPMAWIFLQGLAGRYNQAQGRLRARQRRMRSPAERSNGRNEGSNRCRKRAVKGRSKGKLTSMNSPTGNGKPGGAVFLCLWAKMWSGHNCPKTTHAIWSRAFNSSMAPADFAISGSPFILTVDWFARVCYLPDKRKFIILF